MTRVLTIHAETALISQMKQNAIGFLPSEAFAPYTLTYMESGVFKISWPTGERVFSLGPRREVLV